MENHELTVLEKNRNLTQEELGVELAPVYRDVQLDSEEIQRRINTPIAGILFLSIIIPTLVLAPLGILIGYMWYFIGILGAAIVGISFYYLRQRGRTKS